MASCNKNCCMLAYCPWSAAALLHRSAPKRSDLACPATCCSGAPAKKQRPEPPSKAASNVLDEAVALPAAPPQLAQRQQKATSRKNSEGRPQAEGRPAGKPASSAAAGRPAKREADGGAKPTKSERGGKEASRGGADKATAKAAAAERAAKKEAAAAERPAKKEAGAGKAAAAGARDKADKPAKPRPQAVANGRPAKPAPGGAGKPAAAAKAPPLGPAAALKQAAQQEHAGSTPTSQQLEGAAAGAELRAQQATSRPAAAKAEPRVELKAAQGSSNLGTQVEAQPAPGEPARAVGELVLSSFRGHAELWEALRARFAGALLRLLSCCMVACRGGR